jgi:hypothetical protein
VPDECGSECRAERSSLDRYAGTAALGFGGIYERFKHRKQAGFANDPIAYRAAARLRTHSNQGCL